MLGNIGNCDVGVGRACGSCDMCVASHSDARDSPCGDFDAMAGCSASSGQALRLARSGLPARCERE
eukprot:13935665-Alexandrium_andersonii.AAC.1